MTNKKIAKILQKSASAMMAFIILATSMPVGFFTNYVATVAAQEVVTNSGIASVIATATPASFQTFDNPYTKSVPPALNASIGVVLSESYVGGAEIRVPLPKTPEGSNWTELHGPLFTINTPESHPIVREFDLTTDPTVIIIRLKSKTDEGYKSGLATIPLSFTFNSAYKWKVPMNTALYTMAPTVSINGNTSSAPVTNAVVRSMNLFSYHPEINNVSGLEDNKYSSRNVQARFNTTINDTHTMQLEGGYEHKEFFQIPRGSQITTKSAAWNNLVTFDKVVEVDGVEYDQYVGRIVENSDFSRVRYYDGQRQGQLYGHAMQISFTLPEELMQEWKSFKIRRVFQSKFVNANLIEEIQEKVYTYKSDVPFSNILSKGHSTLTRRAPISGIEENQRTMASVFFAWDHNVPGSTTQNNGSESIKNVKLELFQVEQGVQDSKTSASPKINFNHIYLYRFRSVADAKEMKVRYYYEIKNTKKTTNTADDAMRVDENPLYVVNSAMNGTNLKMDTLKLPQLNDGEYIHKVVVVPMGADGSSEGEWLAKNGFMLGYWQKGWKDALWPDGTPMGTTNAITMAGNISYLDNPNKPGSYPVDASQIVTYPLNNINLFYTKWAEAYASMQIVDNAWKTVGDIVDANILGYNFVHKSIHAWKDPVIVVRVPKFAELVDIDSPKTLTQPDINKSGIVTAPVNVVLTHSDNLYNYYSFRAEGYNTPLYKDDNATPVFSIPVQFRIKEWAVAGNFPVRVYTSQWDASTFSRVTAGVLNDAGDGVTRQKLGIPEGGNYIYSNNMASSPFSIFARSEIAVATTIKNSATNGIFSPASVVPAKSNEDVTMRLTVRNTGSTELDRLKIYNILPYNNDALGSNGNVILKDVTSSKTGFTVKTTKTPVNNLLKYGEHNTANAAEPDLQTATIVGNWENGVPADKNGLSGLFVDFGNTRILPGEEVNVDLTFTIPDGVSQSAFNQFRYSAQEVGNANVKFNLNSTKAGFDTTYIDNVAPVVTLTGNAEMSVRQNATFTDPGATWTDNIDGTGRIAKGTIVEKNGQAVTNGGTTIDTAEIATYKLEYTYTDAGNNPGNKVYRTLRVTDGIAPNIVFKNGVVNDNGTHKLDVEMKSNFNPENYVTITDNVAVTKKGSYLGNSEPTTLPTTFATVDTNTPGQKVVSYIAVDASGNKTTKKLVLNVRDSQAPNISLVGNATISIPVGSTFTDAGANWTDTVDGGGNVKAFEGSVDANTVGSYTLKYKHTDRAGNTSQVITRTIKVVAANKTALNKIIDAVSPISTNPEKVAKIVGINGVDTATAKSILETAFEESKTVKENPNATQAQVDEATRKLTAALANVALDTEKPVITIAPTAQNTYTVGATVDKMAGITATDKVRPSDNAVDVTGSIAIDSENPDFDPNTVGTYNITYIVTDTVGNTAKITRTINIVAADNSTLVAKVQEAERAMNNPKVVQDDNKDALTEEIRKAKEIIWDENSTPDAIAAAITALQDAITALTVDNIAPVVTPNPVLPAEIKVGDSIDATTGLTSVDDIDGDISATVTYTIAKVTGYEGSGEPMLGETLHTGTFGDGEKNFAKIGTVAIVYTSTDAKNNTTRVVRVVSVERADNDLLGTAITEGEQTVTNPNTVHNPALDELKQAIEDGKKVFDDENSTQAQIDDAKAKIDDAKSKVDARDPAKVKDLRDLIDDADVKLTNPHLVHDDIKKALDDALNKARDILTKNTTTNKDLDDAINTINDLINNLQERDPNAFDNLREAITNGQNTSNDPNTVHNDTKTNLDKAIEDATKILDNPSTTQQQIDDAKKAIEDLIAQVEKRDPANFDDLDDFIKKAEDASNAPDVVNDDKKADLDKKIKDLKEMKDDPKTSNEDIVNKKKEILDAIAALNKKKNTYNNSSNGSGPGGYVGGSSSDSSPTQWTSPIIPTPNSTSPSNNNIAENTGNNIQNEEESISFNAATSIPNNPQLPTIEHISATPRIENGNILTQHITAKEGTENTFSVNNPLTNGVCTDIIRAHTYNDLVAKDNPQTAPFHDDIAALMMFRGAEKADNNIPNYEEYKRHGVVLNTEYFSPNRSVTRAEFVKMLVRSLSCHYAHLGTDTGFSDVENDKWYAEYIKFAVENKWINGYKDGTFRPNAPITRDEAAKILSRAISLDTANATTETHFSDVEKGSEFIPYIESLKNLGVMKGRTSEKFAPKEQISRGETARIIYRTFFGGKL